MTDPVSPAVSDEMVSGKPPAGGLAAYAQRCRADHRRMANGWCSCDRPLCPERYLLDHIDDLIRAYELKVADFAKETLRNSTIEAEARADERRKIVAWLNDQPGVRYGLWARQIADRIKRGEHL